MTRTRTKQKQSSPPNDLVSGPVLARWLGVTDKTVREMAKAGIVVRVKRGLYKLEDSVTRYCERIRRTASQRGGEASLATLRDERIRIAKEQADALALKNAAARGELLDAGAVEADWSTTLRNVRAGMLAVPSRTAARLPHLTPHDVAEIDAEVRAVLTEIGTGTSSPI
jgi:phage terminase Nu1 subunit (DNA packaging protein)